MNRVKLSDLKYGLLPRRSPTGKDYYVLTNSSADAGDLGFVLSADADGETRVFSTIDAAIGACTASRGDVIWVLPGHSETVSAAAGIAVDVAGISIIGLGNGANRPVVTFGTATGASMLISASNVLIKNIVGLAALDGLTSPFDVTGSNVELDVEWRDASASVEAATVVRAVTVSNLKVKLLYKGFTAGNAAVRVISLNAVTNGFIDIDAHGVVSVAWVNFVTVASTNVSVRGRLYTQGITNFTRDVVDTVTGSTWDAVIFDASAGAQVSGGSAAALAVDDVATVAAGVGAVADAALADTIEGAAASTQSLITDVKGVLQRLGADSANNTAATTLVAANADGSVLERLEYLQANATAQTPATFVPGLGFRVTKTEDVNTAVGDALFTVTGKVLITLWTGEVTNALDAAVTDYKLTLQTANADLCAAGNLASAAVGFMFSLNSDAGDTSLSMGSYAVSVTSTADTNGKGLANRIVGKAGGTDTIGSLRTAGAAGDAIVHTVFYLPLEAGASLVAAA